MVPLDRYGGTFVTAAAAAAVVVMVMIVVVVDAVGENGGLKTEDTSRGNEIGHHGYVEAGNKMREGREGQAKQRQR